jgi:hypothetical protein
MADIDGRCAWLKDENVTELMNMEKWREKWTGQKRNITHKKLEKWQEKWTICLAPGTNATELIKI